MAAALFDPARNGFLTAIIPWTATPTFKASLVRGYTFSASHTFVSDVTGAGGTLVATTTLTGLSSSAGVANASSPVTWTAVASGAAIPGILIYMSSAATGGADVAATAQRLVCYIDDASGLPVTPNGGDITWALSTGATKLFKL